MICNKCLYDDSIPNITYDENGVCQFCHQYDELEKEYPTGDEGKAKLVEIVSQIKKAGKNNRYDCVVGVSGGCDSSYLLHQAKEYGLRPLAVNFDNGWGEDIADQNLAIMIKKLEVDFLQLKVDREELDDIFRSFMLSSVPELEAPTDIALATAAYIAADAFNIKYIFDGHSFRTESIAPPGLFYFDGKYIDDIHTLFGNRTQKTFPNMRLFPFLKWMFIKRIKRIRPLYYMGYNKDVTKDFLTLNFGWNWYGGHHHENRFTIFCNRYYMPKKFGIDLRKIEYSALIRSGQISKKDAIELMAEPLPECKEIIEEVKERFNFTDKEFDDIMKKPTKSYLDFKTYKKTFELLKPIFWAGYKLDLVPKSFYTKYAKG
jgi:N-acetyl sugar amidotransferase